MPNPYKPRKIKGNSVPFKKGDDVKKKTAEYFANRKKGKSKSNVASKPIKGFDPVKNPEYDKMIDAYNNVNRVNVFHAISKVLKDDEEAWAEDDIDYDGLGSFASLSFEQNRYDDYHAYILSRTEGDEVVVPEYLDIFE